MVFRLAGGAAVAGLSAVALAAGCSSSTSTAPSDAGGGDSSMTGDTGSPADGGGDSASPVEDGATDGGFDAVACALADGGAYPVGTQLVAGTNLGVGGLTSDGYAVYVDATAANLYTISTSLPAGQPGTPVLVDAYDGSGFQTDGTAVLAWTGATQAMGPLFGALKVWTAAHGVQALATASLGPNNPGRGWADVSSDGKYVLYFDNASSGSTPTADLYVAGVDGAGKTKLVPGVVIVAGCYPQIGFVGDFAVASYCTSAPAPDGGTGATLATWSGSSWATTTTVTPGAYGSWSTDGKGLVAYQTTGGLAAYAVATAASTPIDPVGVGGLFTSDSASLVYTATDGSIRRSTVTSPSPQVVLPGGDAGSGYQGILALSPDDGHLLAYQNVNATYGFTDLYLSSTAAGSTATALSTATSAGVYGDPFTADGTHALYFANLDSSDVGDYDEMAVTSTTPTTIGSFGWEGLATTAGKVVFDDNWVAVPGTNGQADLQAIDMAAATPAVTTLVSAIDAYFFVSADKSKLVYTWSYCPDARAGLYVTSTP